MSFSQLRPVAPQLSPRARVCVALLGLGLCLLTGTAAREFVATDEWQVLDPEDSIPAGLHVRLDMETGLRLAKLNVPGDPDLITSQSDLSSMRALATTPPPPPREPGQMDFDMMHRMYERIPEAERPPLPGPGLPREQFEKELRALWEERQSAIREAAANLADVPDILGSMISNLASSASPGAPDLPSLASLLPELDYLLSDLDIARDFRVLGGWPVLLGILGDEGLPADARAAAARCVGTAVKNAPEFHDWVSPSLLSSLLSALSSPSPALLRAALYAVSSCLRGNPLAQSLFLDPDLDPPGPASLHPLLASPHPPVPARLVQLAADLST
ncbi:hypothetical protein TeGR_g4409, partial [Tetraparma gracilis]